MHTLTSSSTMTSYTHFHHHNRVFSSQCCSHLLTKPTTSPPTSTSSTSFNLTPRKNLKLANRWKEYQGIRNWDGLLDPLDDNLRSEILRYGRFVDAAYTSFDIDTSSPTYATCRFPKSTLLDRAGFPGTGYRLTRNLRSTSSIQPTQYWLEKAPAWMTVRSSWIGYVAVCEDKDEISRLGRRDIVIAFRGTATCLEWVENLRANLADFSPNGPMVQTGFLSLYTSGPENGPSLQEMIREEIQRLLEMYSGEPLSLTITGHSMGAALATLAAYDIKMEFNPAEMMITVISFGGPRVGDKRFKQQLEKQGTKVLRIVNSDDVITKVPFGFVSDGRQLTGGWMAALMRRWVYSEVGKELRLSSSKCSPYLNGINVATCHDLKTYMHLVNGYVSSSCPFRSTTTTGRLNKLAR